MFISLYHIDKGRVAPSVTVGFPILYNVLIFYYIVTYLYNCLPYGGAQFVF